MSNHLDTTPRPATGDAHPETLERHDTFPARHIGPTEDETLAMLETLGIEDLEALCRETIPAAILRDPESEALDLGQPRTEESVLNDLRELASRNQVFRSFLGAGYYDSHTPAVIQRNILENPGWYTQYTAYQAEISQGRLEMLLNFQTLVSDLTALPLANASLLDEATAAAEAMSMCRNQSKSKSNRFFVATDCHPQTRAVVATRAEPLDIEVVYGHPNELEDLADLDTPDSYFGILIQYPTTDGRVFDCRDLIRRAHAQGTYVAMATDLLALTLLAPPGELGADVAIGSAQRFGVPLGYGGPHAAFLSATEEFKRMMPGRIVGISKDSAGKPAYRLALQTREQHIRRAKATSNICTAQALLAVISAAFGMYHGPEGLRAIATRVHQHARVLAAGLRKMGLDAGHTPYFDTLRVKVGDAQPAILRAAESRRMNLRPFNETTICVSVDETTTAEDLERILESFAEGVSGQSPVPVADLVAAAADEPVIDDALRRTSTYLEADVFHRYRSEHEMLRYLKRLESRDLSLTTSMIPLGSCTMKLNAAAEMIALSWPEFASLHPFVPKEQAAGYAELFRRLEHALGEITGLPKVSLQPNAGAQGEYASLLVIRKYHASRGQGHRRVCLIPDSAHGTNPASAVMAGMQVVAVRCDEQGNIDLGHLREQAEKHADNLAACMITYPSTHGVFEASIRDACQIVHDNGGQVFLDGANMNAQVGLCRPGDYGADICHLNLHKTFCIPHGGGGPGMGPICMVPHLAPHAPGHPIVDSDRPEAVGPVAAAPYGSPSILTISHAYIAMMGYEGLRMASQYAILNANYMARRLSDHYKILYTGKNGRVAHEFIVDVRPFKASADITVDDVAKRLVDYGFHAPTMSWPVAGTLMVEPTESESKEELDRFCDAMIAIREEIRAIESGKMDREVNPLKMSPHTAEVATATEWDRPYSREQAIFPLPHLRAHKFWPPVGRIDNAFGDRNLVCTCQTMEAYADG